MLRRHGKYMINNGVQDKGRPSATTTTTTTPNIPQPSPARNSSAATAGKKSIVGGLFSRKTPKSTADDLRHRGGGGGGGQASKNPLTRSTGDLTQRAGGGSGSPGAAAAMARSNGDLTQRGPEAAPKNPLWGARSTGDLTQQRNGGGSATRNPVSGGNLTQRWGGSTGAAPAKSTGGGVSVPGGGTPGAATVRPDATQQKRQGVLGGPSTEATSSAAATTPLPRHSKSDDARRQIRVALANNELLANLEAAQTAAVVDAMYERRLEAGSVLIREGEAGSNLFVSAEGSFEVFREGRSLLVFGPGRVFGEIAILYDTPRQASVRVLSSPASVWVISRRVFQQVMVRLGLQRSEDHVRFLRSVPLLKDLDQATLRAMADLLKVRFYAADSLVVRQGDHGDAFYVVTGGSVKVVKDGRQVALLDRGDYFGEQALLRTDVRQASVVAMGPRGVECLELQREHFQRLLGGLKELQEKDYSGAGATQRRNPQAAVSAAGPSSPLLDVELADLQSVATLGVGGFGRVELVRSRKPGHVGKVWALKALKKAHVVEQRQQEHALSEKAAMTACRECPHVARLERTFRDAKYVYLLMEACLGGDVFTQLQRRHLLEERAARFVAASVLEALDFVHARGFVYRDLKPENLLLDARGYVKLVDFGFAKRLAPGAKTWTFAGTPEYVAPEVVLNKGHDRAVDLWSLGVLVHELLTGAPPFRGADHVATYNLILKGVEAVHFPAHVTKHAQDLIRRLCRAAPTERLGYHKEGLQEVRDHRWFRGFDWASLRKGSLKAPIVPTLKSVIDVSNFDHYPADHSEAPDELSGWDKDF